MAQMRTAYAPHSPFTPGALLSHGTTPCRRDRVQSQAPDELVIAIAAAQVLVLVDTALVIATVAAAVVDLVVAVLVVA
jgi:hypothetical protein